MTDPASPTARRFKHYATGATYRLLHEATQEADLEPVVVYQSETDGRVWVRPARAFFGKVAIGSDLEERRFSEVTALPKLEGQQLKAIRPTTDAVGLS